METITLEYDIGNKQARQMIEIIQSLGLATRKKSGGGEALEDVVNGRTTIHTQTKGNAGEIMKMLDSMKSENIFADIVDPFAYQRQLRDEWER